MSEFGKGGYVFFFFLVFLDNIERKNMYEIPGYGITDVLIIREYRGKSSKSFVVLIHKNHLLFPLKSSCSCYHL